MTKLFREELRQGDEGSDVKVMQLLLKAAGWDSQNKVIADGVWGNATSEMVAHFQRLTVHPDIPANEVGQRFGAVSKLRFFERTGINLDDLEDDFFIDKTVWIRRNDR